MSQSLADELLGMPAIAQKEIELPSGRKIYVGELTGLEWLEIRLECNEWKLKNDENHDKLFDARMAIRSLNDGKGNLIFQAGDEAKVMGMPKHVLEMVMEAVNDANKSHREFHDEAKKNSLTLTSPSLGDSPETSAA